MFDFHSAYLSGVLDDGEMIYMEQPPYHEVVSRSHYVVKLCKSLYGLKQAGRKWYDMLCGSLAIIGFQKSMADPAVFFIHTGSDVVFLSLVACTFVNNPLAVVDRPLCTVPRILLQCYCKWL